MLKKIDKRIPIIIILVIIYIILVVLYLKPNTNSFDMKDIDKSKFTKNTDTQTTSTKKESISATASISSSITEKLDLHNTYKLSKLYVEENETVSSGDKILKYTNGTYLKAPYDLVITSINLPDEKDTLTNEHYIEVSSLNALQVEFSVSESKISNVEIGDEVTIKISALDNKEYTGRITNISNIASNEKFTVVAEFENDGDVMIGMSATITT